MSRRWVFPDPEDPAAVRALAAELRLPHTLCRLLVQRGRGTSHAAREFLRPGDSQLHPPGAMAGMAEAVARLSAAIRSGETILVHGDYDVDGICSTAILARALRMMGGKPVPFVPHRIDDGYDLTGAGIQAAASAGASLILTADCGIVAHEAVDRASALGIDVIVTDHHTPGPTLPAALAVINPSRTDCPYPEKGLAGAGVAFKLVLALAGEMGLPLERLAAFLDLVAIATVADLAPLGGENRLLVRRGLQVLARTPNPGLQALLRSSGLDEEGEITAGQVGFILAPRINAVGRMGDAMVGVRLLLCDDRVEAESIAATLESHNRLRRQVDEETLEEAMRMLEGSFDPARDRGVVLASESWHPGVIGIVASRVVELIHRPAVLIALGADEGKGSARSIRGFHLHEAFRACSEHLTRFGGHRAAAGCSLRPQSVDAFREAFDAHARSVLTEEMLVPEIRVDAELRLGEATSELHRLLRHLAPFGIGNPTPVFATLGARAEKPRLVGGRHLKLTLVQEDARLEAIGFGMGDRLPECAPGSGPVDVAFKLEENRWRPAGASADRVTLQARIVDMRPAR
jgi:single-stranded-DNA-specific exonuclease